MEEVVTLSLEAPLAVVTLNRPKSLNALNSEVYRQLIAILRRVEAMDEIRVIILTGAGEKAFAAGADIAQMVHEDSMAARRLSGLCHEAAGLLENMRQVTIAAVNGYALGGGCELTLACDIRIASDSARFALPEVTLGIIPGGGGTQRLARIIGTGRAKEMIFTGDQIDAQEAWRMGLANHVVPKEDLMATCRALENYPGLLKLNVSADDAKRKDDIRANEERKILQEKLTPEEYIRSLGVHLQFSYDVQEQVGRRW